MQYRESYDTSLALKSLQAPFLAGWLFYYLAEHRTLVGELEFYPEVLFLEPAEHEPIE
jgi:hypothetical protein